ncbi:MAG: Tex family protein [Bacillota bacterium]|jgi:uncharacterized protein
MGIIDILQKEFEIKSSCLNNIIALLDEGNTVPFIARYRKEMTGSCDDQVLRSINDRLNYLRNLEKRKAEVIAHITELEKMTDELLAAINEADTLAKLDDIYRPYKQKKRTRATIAKEKGLQPLADIIFAQKETEGTVEEIAEPFINPEQGVSTVEDAIKGACDIIAEIISDSAEGRNILRKYTNQTGLLTVTGNTEEDSVYSMYYDYAEPLHKIPSHRILAINRGEKEGLLKVRIEIDHDEAVYYLSEPFVYDNTIYTDLMDKTVLDAYNRLIYPSIEREIRSDLTTSASEQAIKVFGLNLKSLLMQAPIKGKVAMGFDPAYRTGCKIAIVDATGKVLNVGVVYPTPPQKKIQEAKDILTEWIKIYGVEIIAVGNGTASKESEIFIAELINEIPEKIQYMMVNEAGASVYSASKLGAEEFPDYDVSLRSAVSIARRLQDPLAELVKIDPKSVGVGQYQHDMPPKRLDETLEGVVEDCVNKVGVDLNTASASLLSYIAGLSSATAKNIVKYREEEGSFTSRNQLKKVSKLGPKTFQQCAGFLRIPRAKNPLDNTGVHPESYDAVKKLLEMFGCSLKDFSNINMADLQKQVRETGTKKVAAACGIGVPTLEDILQELAKPGRDLRDELPPPMLRSDIMDMNDLQQGMILKGTVRNVIDFGAFVDIGVHQDGLVHISQITDRYIKHPSEVLQVGDVVSVEILNVDLNKKRISLTMKCRS